MNCNGLVTEESKIPLPCVIQDCKIPLPCVIQESKIPLPLLPPIQLWIRVLNEYLTFSETRCQASPYLFLGREWFKSYKTANKQLQLAYMTVQSFNDVVHILLNSHLPRLKTLVFHQLTETELTRFVSVGKNLPKTVTSVNISFYTPGHRVLASSWLFELVDFIIANDNLRKFTFCQNLDFFANASTSAYFNKRLIQKFNVQIEVGRFVSLASECPNSKPQYNQRLNDLRWVNQCPFDNCTERFCWGLALCGACDAKKHHLVACCPAEISPVRLVCASHFRKYFKIIPRFQGDAMGRATCARCANDRWI